MHAVMRRGARIYSAYQLLDYGNRIYFKTIFVRLLKLIF